MVDRRRLLAHRWNPAPAGAGRVMALGSIVLMVTVAGCGGSSRSSSTGHSATSVAPSSTTTSTSAASTPTSTKTRTTARSQTRTTSTSTTRTRTAASRSTTTRASTTTQTSTTTHTSTHRVTKPAYAKPMHATLTGANHDPTVNKLWPYTVTATDAKGRPLSGTVDIEFTFHGVVVGHDTPPTHPIRNGRWHDNLKFPAQSVGQPISLQAVVHTQLGSVTLDWPIKVKK